MMSLITTIPSLLKTILSTFNRGPSKLIFFALLSLTDISAVANEQTKLSKNEYLPSALLNLDPFFSHHVIVAEKSTHKLYIFKNIEGTPTLLKTYQMATGKKAGDKVFQGDHRTPEGVFYLTEFLPHENLLQRHGKQGEIYGVGAFVLNYPNPIDEQLGKTGGGIWLHSTNDETRIEKGLDSRGCIVTANTDLIDAARFIELNRTPIVVLHELEYLSRERWETKRQKLLKTVETWAKAWREEDLDTYISAYHDDFQNPGRGDKSAYKAYKRAVFAQPGKPEVVVRNLNIIQARDYVAATFEQVYSSETIQDVGRKTLYLKQNEYYDWKIVAEKWSKHGLEDQEKDEESVPNQVASFRPSQRFFEQTNPKAILGDRLLNSVGSLEIVKADQSKN